MGILSRISALFGRGDEDELSVPAMDGLFKPNTRLDTAERLFAMSGIDNLAVAAGRLHFSSGRCVYRFDFDQLHASPLVELDGVVTMLTAAPDGSVVAAAEGAGLRRIDPGGEVQSLAISGDGSSCVTAGLFENEDTLLLAIGSQRHPMPDWKRDLMSHGTSGNVLRYRLSTGRAERVVDGLAFPYGLARLADGGIAVAESWRHRILSVPPAGRTAATTLLGELPAYPARLSPASDGGFWLALFAPRRQLTELVLNDDDYRLDMMATIPPEAWIGPDLGDGSDEEQPLQAGSVRQMGIMKPWAPSRSYGLVVRLDRDMQPVASYHSRADGRMHGITSVVEMDGHLYAASRGAGMLIRLDLSERPSP